MAVVEQILSFPSKDKTVPPVEVEWGVLEADCGLQGDSRADGGDRQLTVLPTETKEWIESEEAKGRLCVKLFKGNLEISGLDVENLKKDDILSVGPAEIQLTRVGKPCWPDDCSMAYKEPPCVLRQTAIFARVIKTGKVRPGDTVEKK